MKRIFDWFSHGAWFDFGREMGIREEHDRIIKLLLDNCHCIEECYCTWNKALFLVKGEQK